MLKKINWGILGTGYAATKFAEGLLSLPHAQLLAVGSRSQSTAQAFAQRFSILHAHSSYADLVKDKEIDVVYVATSHIRPRDDCTLCLEAGKAVICEKPFTLNAQEAREIIALARQQQLFCMEGMWMRFIPVMQKVRQMIDNGIIGEICILTANFGIPAEFDPNNRFFNLELGGGTFY